MDRPDVFYNREDQWEGASHQPAGGERMGNTTRSCACRARPGECIRDAAVHAARGQLAAWMVSRGDGVTRQIWWSSSSPSRKLIFGPRQVVARINQDQVISPRDHAVGPAGLAGDQGTLVIPIEESLLYVRALPEGGGRRSGD
jgi:uncharacterized membrane protein (UPF0182 family)